MISVVSKVLYTLKRACQFDTQDKQGLVFLWVKVTLKTTRMLWIWKLKVVKNFLGLLWCPLDRTIPEMFLPQNLPRRLADTLYPSRNSRYISSLQGFLSRWNSAPHNALLELAKVGSRETVAQLCEGILLPLAQLLMKSREKDRTVSKIPNWDREICQCCQSYEKIASRVEALFKVVLGNAQYDVLMHPNFPPTLSPWIKHGGHENKGNDHQPFGDHYIKRLRNWPT